MHTPECKTAYYLLSSIRKSCYGKKSKLNYTGHLVTLLIYNLAQIPYLLQTSDKYQFVEHTMSSNAFSLSKE
jgi:hypothetical protein